MSVEGRLGGPIQNLGLQLTPFRQREEWVDYAHDITVCPPGFENVTTSQYSNMNKKYSLTRCWDKTEPSNWEGKQHL